MILTAVDFETYYHEKQCSIRVQGTQGYIRHPEFDAYLVSVVTENGDEFCGHPTEFDWECISEGHLWLSHNKGFDCEVYRYLIETGVLPDVEPEQWYCTADMCAYHGLPGDLNRSLKYLFGHSLDKGVRDAMSGKRFEDLTPDEKDELITYALEDSRWLIPLFQKLGPTWPEHERKISNLTIDMKRRGLPIDAEKLDKSLKSLKRTMFDAEEEIPWWGAEGYKNKTPLSSKAMAEECRRLKIPAPASRAKGDPECTAWLKKFGDKHKFVRAMQVWNSCNTMLKKLEVLHDRLLFDDPEEMTGAWMPFGLRYCGAHTGRDTGGDGFNVLNLNKDDVFGVDIRSHIVPPPGMKFLSVDYSQIEPRVAAWLVGDFDLLDVLAEGRDPYVHFGLNTMGHKGEWTDKDRSVWKVMVLQLAYGSGWQLFQSVAKSWYGVELTNVDARQLVKQYRKKNKLITDKWEELEKQLVSACKSKGGEGWLIFDLPSGRHQFYRDVSRLRGLSALIADEGGWQIRKFYGGKLFENLIQAIARDVFFDGYIRLEEAGHTSVLRVYDEFLILTPEDKAEENKEAVVEIMRQPPSWAPDLPLEAECEILDFYKK